MSEPTSSPKVNIYLSPRPGICYLSNVHPFEPRIIIKSRDSRPFTFLATGTIFDPIATFSRNRVEIVDSESRTVIAKPLPEISEKSAVQPNYQDEEPFSFITLGGNCHIHVIYFSTTPHTGHMGRIYFPFHSTGLVPGRKYTLRLRDSGVTWWKYGSKEDLGLPQTGVPGSLVPSESTSLDFHCQQSSEFRVASDLPESPNVSVSLSTSSDICHLSGHPLFTVRVTFTLYDKKPLTLNTNLSPLGAQSIAQIVDANTRAWVGIDFLDCVGVREDGPWAADDFVVLTPEQPHIQEIKLDREILDNLRSGKEYVACLGADGGSRSTFKWWSYDSIEQVLQYAGMVGGSGLYYVPPIAPDLSAEVRFTAVDP